MIFTPEYLGQLAEMETPPTTMINHDEREEYFARYRVLRDYAKDLLENPENEKRIRELSRLIKILGVEQK